MLKRARHSFSSKLRHGHNGRSIEVEVNRSYWDRWSTALPSRSTLTALAGRSTKDRSPWQGQHVCIVFKAVCVGQGFRQCVCHGWPCNASSKTRLPCTDSVGSLSNPCVRTPSLASGRITNRCRGGRVVLSSLCATCGVHCGLPSRSLIMGSMVP